MSKVRVGNVQIDFSGLKEVRKEAIKKVTDMAIKRAINYAQTTLVQAWDKSTFTDRTFNLMDSYVWGVYLDGKRESYGFLNPAQKATSKIKQTASGAMLSGHEEGQKFIDGYKSRVPKGIEIVLATAMYYGAYLENGTRRNSKYVVLTAVLDKLESDFNDVEVTINEYTY